MKYDLKRLKNEIAAIIPSAHPEGGEATLLITTGGDELLDRRSYRWILRRLAFFHNTDSAAARENYGPLLGCKRYIPLALGPNLVYFPLPLFPETLPGERRLGYISAAQVASVEEESGAVILVLNSGARVTCCESRPTVGKRLGCARALQQLKTGEYLSELPEALAAGTFSTPAVAASNPHSPAAAASPDVPSAAASGTVNVPPAAPPVAPSPDVPSSAGPPTATAAPKPCYSQSSAASPPGALSSGAPPGASSPPSAAAPPGVLPAAAPSISLSPSGAADNADPEEHLARLTAAVLFLLQTTGLGRQIFSR